LVTKSIESSVLSVRNNILNKIIDSSRVFSQGYNVVSLLGCVLIGYEVLMVKVSDSVDLANLTNSAKEFIS
jgi:hypothetical protein